MNVIEKRKRNARTIKRHLKTKKVVVLCNIPVTAIENLLVEVTKNQIVAFKNFSHCLPVTHVAACYDVILCIKKNSLKYPYVVNGNMPDVVSSIHDMALAAGCAKDIVFLNCKDGILKATKNLSIGEVFDEFNKSYDLSIQLCNNLRTSFVEDD